MQLNPGRPLRQPGDARFYGDPCKTKNPYQIANKQPGGNTERHRMKECLQA